MKTIAKLNQQDREKAESELGEVTTGGDWRHVCQDGLYKVTNGYTTVAWLDFWQTPDCTAQKTQSEQLANARLIAGAPELLKENTQLRVSLQSLLNWTYNQSAPLEDIREQAKQILAKGGAR